MARETETARVAVANNRNNSSGNEIAEAREVAEWIQSSGDIFLERLISHLSQLPRLQTVPAAYLYDPSKHESTETSKENSSGGNECSGKQNDDGGDGDGDGDGDAQLPRLQTVPAAYLYDPSKHESTETSKENSSGGNECSGKQNDDGGDGDGDGDGNDEDDGSNDEDDGNGGDGGDDGNDEYLLLRRGMTLPAAAVAWLSGQLEALDRTKQQSEQQTGRFDDGDGDDNDGDDNDGDDDGDGDDGDGDDGDDNDGDSPQPTTETIQRERLPQDAEPWIGVREGIGAAFSFESAPTSFAPCPADSTESPTLATDETAFVLVVAVAVVGVVVVVIIETFETTPQKMVEKAAPTVVRETDPFSDHNGDDPVGNDSSISSSSSIENNGSTTRAVQFLQYSGFFPNNGGAPKCIRLHRVFPSATILILEGVPPSWIELDGTGIIGRDPAVTGTNLTATKSNEAQRLAAPLGVITVRKAAIYSLEEFLPAVSEVPPYNSAPSPTASAVTVKDDNALVVIIIDTLEIRMLFAGRIDKGVCVQSLATGPTRIFVVAPKRIPDRQDPVEGLAALDQAAVSGCELQSNRGFFRSLRKSVSGGTGPNAHLVEQSFENMQNSGLEKCFALREIWLDSNRIEDVLEVSGLAGLPELQFLALQDNPFSTKPRNGTKIRTKTLSKFKSVSSPSLPDGSSNNRSTDNPHYDRDWKIRLWTWFDQERRARTPLELPLLKRRSKHKTFKNFADSDAAVSIGRMTREQWDKIRERSFSSLATTSGGPYAAASSTIILETTRTREQAAAAEEESQGLRGTKSNGANETNGLATSDSSPTETPPATSIPGVRLMAPMCNPRVTRKSKIRKVKINIAEGECSRKNKNYIYGSSTEKPKRRQGPRKSKEVNTRSANVDGSKRLATADKKVSESVSTAIGRALASTHFGTSSFEQTGLQSNIRFDIPPDKSMPLHSDRTKYQLSFSLEDVLISLQQQNQKSMSNLEESSVDASVETRGNDKNTLLGEEESVVHPLFPNVNDLDGEEDSDETKATSNDDTPNNPFANDSGHADIEDDTSLDNKTSTNVDEEGKDELVVNDHREDKKEIEIEANHKPEESVRHNSTKEESTNDIDALNTPEQNFSECNDDCKSTSTDEASNTRSAISSKHSSPRRSPQRMTRRKEDTVNEDRIFVKPKVATIQLNRMSKYRPFDALTSDWDELVKKASEGRIPDGLVKSPVATTIESSEEHTGHSNKEIFSENQADLLASKSAESTSNTESTAINPAAPSRSASEPVVEPSLSPYNGTSNTLPEHIWQEDNSVLSSLGASRDEIVPRDRINKFQLAEENSSYDGPDSSRGLKVFENLDLYFETFVFPILMPDIPMDVLGEMEEDEDDWQLITMYHPRIQLWPDDRRVLEKMRIISLIDSTRWTANRERFCRVWAEDLIPCGKPALRRLPPNRRIRFGFHGDKLFEEGNVDAYSECRKVLLCLSTKALYVIPEKDDVTLSHQQQANKRRFPLPLDRRDRFRDAPWPHAVARHPLGDLEAICIGFEFQRLTLRFRNPTLPGSDPFVYILLTGDKRTTVRILQEIQKLAKDLKDNDAIGQSSSTNGKKSADLPIENDAHIVLDSLNSVLENSGREESIGTIMHFQIVQQQWKRGDRGTVRRVVVITDTMLLLLDEDYAADGHDLSSITIAGHKMADARYRLVDSANISLVSEVQAAGSDPRAITILIKPSTLSRTHRWRLICRDREGAERLVEDARKALETL
eukprot:CAMPEP_0172378308 /NCGR_PEP_ID=MMETSP1060-20121228/69353_1 /TAXON_ID=37318 /ORGANISM="Pseudo-nitzschia pungens, Strain cf. cingulata" /LENGTH=1742 /DNA_ID=CAMNT_0013106025 /DNA_START=161 /DNA_END=5389 /DNA_ORIENTATION=-